jgi:hypothetical protein
VIYDFLILDLTERADLLQKEGVFLMKSRLDDFSFSLYSFKNIYVEIVINDSENQITQVVPFKSGWRLDKYLREIDISASLLIYHR